MRKHLRPYSREWRRRERIKIVALVLATLALFGAAMGFAAWHDYTKQVGIFAPAE
jgi:hypothetical protein